MSDEKLIRLSDAIAALKAEGLPFGYRHAVEVIRAIPAVQVGVKPLEWMEIREGQYFEARVIGILYSVRLGSDGVVRWQAGHMGTWHDAPNLEAAKAAAQADYDARIWSALTAQLGKEVMPDGPHGQNPSFDTSPGVTAGAVPSPDVRVKPEWLTNCAVCGRVVDTREASEGGDAHGCEYEEGWACSSECAEKLSPDPEWLTTQPSPDVAALVEAAVKAERDRIIDALRDEADMTPCDEDAVVVRDCADLIEVDFSYEDAERLKEARLKGGAA